MADDQKKYSNLGVSRQNQSPTQIKNDNNVNNNNDLIINKQT